jgi:hypothetical protein
MIGNVTTALQTSATRAQRKTSSTDCRDDGKNLLDYVIRRFNASSAGLKKPVGLDLRWDTA